MTRSLLPVNGPGGDACSLKPSADWDRSAAPVAGRAPAAHATRWSTGGLTPSLGDGTSHLGGGFALRCCQRFSRPGIATGRCPGQDNPHTSGPSAPVLSYWGRRPARLHAPTTDRDRTVSRRSEPSSRTALMGEQPNPWDRLQPQDATSRHRGAKPCRRCELLGRISLLSPG